MATLQPKGNAQFIRSLNRRLVIDIVRRRGKISRAGLVRAIGVMPSTITSITQELLEEGLVQEVGVGSLKTAGRRPMMLSLDYDYGHALGIYFQSHCVTVGLVTLNGQLWASTEVSYPKGSTPKTVFAALDQATSQLPPSPRLLGVGASVAGFVQAFEQKLIYSPSLDWEDEDLGTPLSKRFSLPICVANDVNALAVGERWHGAGRRFHNFICVSVGEGIGAGIYLEDHLFEGTDGGAGEAGHTCIQLDGPKCRCGENGCLEALAADVFLTHEANQLGLPGDPDELVKVALEGNPKACDLFWRMGRNLGVGLKNLVNLFNPQAIIIGGDRLNALSLFQEPMREIILGHSFSRLSKSLQIVPAQLGKAGWVIGAGTLPLRQMFSPSVLTRTTSTSPLTLDGAHRG